ncbi:MAG: NUDIX domain-containing protein, partial [Myxococcales bacterium]|nr:NUDIX domain-containing protein [Myxococcales bacterium]
MDAAASEREAGTDAFGLLWRGSIAVEALDVELDGRRLVVSSTYELAVDEHWRRILAGAGERVLFDGPLAHLESYSVHADRLRLLLRPSSYRYWLFCAGRRDELTTRYGPDGFHRALAVAAAVVGRDGRLILQRRSARVAECPGVWHVPAGNVALEPEASPTTSILAELAEELNLQPAEIRSLRIVGLAESLANQKPELLYHCQLSCTAAELVSRAADSRDRFEYDRLVHLPLDESAIAAHLAKEDGVLAAPTR